MPIHKSPATSGSQLIFKLAPQIVICSILIILVATLYPFDFSFENGFTLTRIIGKFKQTTTHLSDQIKNLFLFLPFGFGLMCWLHTRRVGTIPKLIIVLASSCILSLFVEVLQAFTPLREPTVADIFNNTFSGVLGIICFYIWNYKVLERLTILLNKKVSDQRLIAIIVGYIAVSLLIPIGLQSTTNLSNWNLDFPLILGNEKSGDRAWRGYISDVYIADLAISTEEVAKVFADKNSINGLGSLVAYYPLNGEDGYSDRTGNLPDLTRGGAKNRSTKRLPVQTVTQPNRGVFLNALYWLEAEQVKSLNQRIRQANQFTIGATIASTGLNNKLGRIISVSNSTTERNFSLEQRDEKLVVRLRTPLGGENATYIMNYVFDVFTDNSPHQIVITYTGSVLQVYLDKLENVYSFNYLEIIPQIDKLLYYGLAFIPSGILLGIILALSQGRFIFYILLYTGIFLPSLSGEFILANSSRRSIDLNNIILSILITTCTVLLFKMRIPFRRKLVN